jgi:hypothetical protein
MNNQELIKKLTVNYIKDGMTIIKELDKKVLNDGAWVTVLFKAQVVKTGEIQVYLNRYQKTNGFYDKKSSFIVQDIKQGYEVNRAIVEWLSLV